MRFERFNELLSGHTAGYRCDAFGALDPVDQEAAWAQLSADCAQWGQEQQQDPILDYEPRRKPSRRLRAMPSPSTTTLAQLTEDLRDLDLGEAYERLTGEEVAPTRKVRCLWHEPDRTPSMHVYDDHVYCFGCGATGTVVDIGAAVYGLEPRGPGFVEITARLRSDLLGEVAA